MKKETVQAFKDLQKLTGEKCAACPSMAKEIGECVPETRCCDSLFCKMVKAHLPKGVKYEEPNKDGILFMSQSGCVVDPHHRPFCTGFVCMPHFKDKAFTAEYVRLIDLINTDPAAPKMKRGMIV